MINNTNKLTTKEINDIAKLMAKTNTAIWNAIALMEDMNNKLNSINCNDEELLLKLMKAFKKLKKNDDAFINAEDYFLDFQDFSSQGKEFNMILEKLED